MRHRRRGGRRSSAGGLLGKLTRTGYLAPMVGGGLIGGAAAGYLAAKYGGSITLPFVPAQFQTAAKGLIAGGPAGAFVAHFVGGGTATSGGIKYYG